MIIIPYKNSKSSALYYRVKPSKEEWNFIKSVESMFYQLKCLTATMKISDEKENLKTENLEMREISSPTKPWISVNMKKAEFGITFSHKEKKSYRIVINLELYPGEKITFKDIFILDSFGNIQSKFIYTYIENQLATELEQIMRKLIDLPTKAALCKNCKYFSEYKDNGFCLNIFSKMDEKEWKW